MYAILGFNALNGPGVEAILGELNLPTIILMEVLYATLLLCFFSRWAQIKTFGTGLKVGLIIGLFIGALPTLELFSTTPGLIDLTGVITGALIFGVRFAVAGGVIGWLLGRELTHLMLKKRSFILSSFFAYTLLFNMFYKLLYAF